MSFPVLGTYLARLTNSAHTRTRVWLDKDGRAKGRYFNCTLTSAFQPIRVLDSSRVVGYEAFARSSSATDSGLSLWKLLDHSANDDESIELDRLCRMLHAINYYRQSEAAHADLYLSVHDRLLAAVSTNHGVAFQRILAALGLPADKIVLQLPGVSQSQGWLLSYVADNYRRNGFRFAVNISEPAEGLALLGTIRPDVLKIDAREIADESAISELLTAASETGTRVVFKRLESVKALEILREVRANIDLPIFAQGFLLDTPKSLLDPFEPPEIQTRPALFNDQRPA